MSEYQFYEFRSIDRPLTSKEQKEIGMWSSRAVPTSTGATFVYNYENFPRSPVNAVATCFDAMFHIANWGTKWLILKFPKELVDYEVLKEYCTAGNAISLAVREECVLLEMFFEDEDCYGWVDGEGYLSSLIGLREDILNGDYRSLYIAWLHACLRARPWDGVELTTLEPTLTHPFKPFNEALECWVELLEVDETLLSGVVDSEVQTPETTMDTMTDKVDLISNREKVDFLTRLLHEEPLLSVKLRKRLRELSPGCGNASKRPRRTVGDIFDAYDRLKEERLACDRQCLEKEKLKKLAMLAAEEDALRERIHEHISQKTARAYDAAVVILKDLHLLETHRHTEADFRESTRDLLNEYSRLSSFKSKVMRAGLL